MPPYCTPVPSICQWEGLGNLVVEGVGELAESPAVFWLRLAGYLGGD